MGPSSCTCLIPKGKRGMVFTGAGACVSFLNLDLVCVCGREEERRWHTHTRLDKKKQHTSGSHPIERNSTVYNLRVETHWLTSLFLFFAFPHPPRELYWSGEVGRPLYLPPDAIFFFSPFSVPSLPPRFLMTDGWLIQLSHTHELFRCARLVSPAMRHKGIRNGGIVDRSCWMDVLRCF